MSHFLPSSRDASAGVGARRGAIGRWSADLLRCGCASALTERLPQASVPCRCSADKMAVCQRYREWAQDRRPWKTRFAP